MAAKYDKPISISNSRQTEYNDDVGQELLLMFTRLNG